MKSQMPYFRIPLNLPHAGTIALRIESNLRPALDDHPTLVTARKLVVLLLPYREAGENPPADEAARVVGEAAEMGRAIVDAIERHGAGHDRLGQAVRNLFECLELGQEGAVISLRAGENPNSALRPT